MMRSSSRATRCPEIDVSGTEAQAFARAVADDDENVEAAALRHLVVSRSATGIGALSPNARLRPPSFLTIDRSSR